MATYNITAHGSLSAASRKLLAGDADAFDACVLIAEDQLGFTGTTFTGDDAKRVKYALSRQVNLIISIDEDSITKSMVVRGPRTDVNKAGNIVDLDPVASRIATSLGVSSAAAMKSIRSLR